MSNACITVHTRMRSFVGRQPAIAFVPPTKSRAIPVGAGSEHHDAARAFLHRLRPARHQSADVAVHIHLGFPTCAACAPTMAVDERPSCGTTYVFAKCQRTPLQAYADSFDDSRIASETIEDSWAHANARTHTSGTERRIWRLSRLCRRAVSCPALDGVARTCNPNIPFVF